MVRQTHTSQMHYHPITIAHLCISALISYFQGKLTILLKNITDLSKGGDVAGDSDPYVVFELEKDNFLIDKSYGERKSSVKMNDLNPVYDEIFEFDAIPSLDKLELKVKVMDKDTTSDDKIGKCKIELDKLDLFSGDPYDVTETVDSNLFSKDAKINLTLQWSE